MSRNVFTVQPTTEGADYPTRMWEAQRLNYWYWYRHFDGDWLEDTVSSSDSRRKYPLRLNPFNMTCLLHAAALFGEVADGDDPLVTPAVEPWNRGSAAERKEVVQKVTDHLKRVWHENFGRSLQQERGILAQILGGVVFGVAYDPRREARNKLEIRIDAPPPEYFFPVPGPQTEGDWNLLEAFIAFQVGQKEARSLGVELQSGTEGLYQEWWTQKQGEITIDGKPTKYLNAPNPAKSIGGLVPYIYIPHIRVGKFYGASLLDGRQEIAQEINERFADVGDVVKENATRIPWATGSQKITVERLSHGMPYIKLGSALPGADTPQWHYPEGAAANNASVEWASKLLNMARTEAFTPPICYGEDEGSQRSGLTLVVRMFPLTAHIRQERTFWTTGLNELNRLILLVSAEKGIGGITHDDIRDLKIYQEWAPILPQEREKLVNEMILRLNAGLIDPEAAVDKLGDIRDTQTMMNLWKEFMKEKAAFETPMNKPFGGAGSQGEQAGQSRPQAPQANLSREE
jgi:hypothetical protein